MKRRSIILDAETSKRLHKTADSVGADLNDIIGASLFVFARLNSSVQRDAVFHYWGEGMGPAGDDPIMPVTCGERGWLARCWGWLTGR